VSLKAQHFIMQKAAVYHGRCAKCNCMLLKRHGPSQCDSLHVQLLTCVPSCLQMNIMSRECGQTASFARAISIGCTYCKGKGPAGVKTSQLTMSNMTQMCWSGQEWDLCKDRHIGVAGYSVARQHGGLGILTTAWNAIMKSPSARCSCASAFSRSAAASLACDVKTVSTDWTCVCGWVYCRGACARCRHHNVTLKTCTMHQ